MGLMGELLVGLRLGQGGLDWSTVVSSLGGLSVGHGGLDGEVKGGQE